MSRLLFSIRLFAAALLSGAALASCDGAAHELPPSPPTVGTLPIGFAAVRGDAWPAPTSRVGELTTSNLRSMSVFASYTGTSDWVEGTHKPNFMYNQKVTRTGSNAPWTYTPMKYWPNTQGEKISFFAFAPALADVSGLSMASSATSTGYPKLKYVVPAAAANQTDLLAAMPLANQTQSTAPLSFQMKHVMTRIQVSAKCTEQIEIRNVQLNDAHSEAILNFTANGSHWSNLTNKGVDFKHTATTTVPANTTTPVAEFFMLPAKNESITVTFAFAGKEETKTATLPTIQWTQGKSIAYMLNIEVGSEITLSVKGWESNTGNNGNMGQEVPSGTQYPYVLNGVVHESATKYYYVGDYARTTYPGITNSEAYTWQECIDICKNYYSWGLYPAREWRLPNVDELLKIRGYKDINTTDYPAPLSAYWASTELNANTAWVIWNTPGQGNPESKTGKKRAVCIRDMGEITVYPTFRVKDGYHIAYIDASTTIRIDFEYNTVADHNSSGYRPYSSAVSRCTNLRKGGYSDWRLPEKAEIEKLIQHVDLLKGCVVWTQTPYPGSSTNVYVWHHTQGWASYAKSSGLDAIAPCVRSY